MKCLSFVFYGNTLKEKNRYCSHLLMFVDMTVGSSSYTFVWSVSSGGCCQGGKMENKGPLP